MNFEDVFSSILMGCQKGFYSPLSHPNHISTVLCMSRLIHVTMKTLGHSLLLFHKLRLLVQAMSINELLVVNVISLFLLAMSVDFHVNHESVCGLSEPLSRNN
jgi:hypothetical protein